MQHLRETFDSNLAHERNLVKSLEEENTFCKLKLKRAIDTIATAARLRHQEQLGYESVLFGLQQENATLRSMLHIGAKLQLPSETRPQQAVVSTAVAATTIPAAETTAVPVAAEEQAEEQHQAPAVTQATEQQ